jgi:hyperosmotically inducible periplasmic protein
MKKVMFVFVAIMSLAIMATSCKKKVKDEDIKKEVEAILAKQGDMMKNATVSVTKGVVTVGGECKDQNCSDVCSKALNEAKIKGVEKIEWNCTVAPPPPTPTSTATNVSVDAAVQQKIKDGLKDIKGAVVAFEGKKALITGAISKADAMKIQQICGAAGVAADLSKATVK